MTKFMTGGYEEIIKPVEVTKETDVSVWIVESYMGKEKETRHKKRSSWHNYFDTWEEAQEWLLEKSQNRIEGLRRQLETEKGHHGNIKGLKKPEAKTP